jgi:hypothetical protein
MLLIIKSIGGHNYRHEGITNVREAKHELRWTNARSEPRSMAWCFIERWNLSEPRRDAT